MRNTRELREEPGHPPAPEPVRPRAWLLAEWGAAAAAAVPALLRGLGMADIQGTLLLEMLLGAAGAALAGRVALRHIFRHRPWWSRNAPALPALLASLVLVATAPAAARDGGASLAWAAPLVLAIHATGLYLLTGGRPRSVRALHDRTVHAMVPLVFLLACAALAVALLAGRPLSSGLAAAAAVLLAPNPRLFAAGRVLALRAAMDRAAALGLHFRRRAVLDQLYAPGTVAFLPEGTLTTNAPRVREVVPAPEQRAGELLELALAGARAAGLPEAGGLAEEAALRGLADRPADALRIQEGLGMAFASGMDEVLLGSPRFLREHGVELAPLAETLRRARSEGRRLTLAARDGVLLGGVLLDDPFRPDAVRTVRLLRKLGRRVAIITAQSPEDYAVTAEQAGIRRVIGGALPAECVHALNELRSETIHRVILVSPDPHSPALASADLGIALHPEAEPSPGRVHLALRGPRLAGLGDAFLLARAVRSARLRAHAWTVLSHMALLALAVAGWLHPAAAALCAQGAWMVLLLNARLLRRFDPVRATEAVSQLPDYVMAE